MPALAAADRVGRLLLRLRPEHQADATEAVLIGPDGAEIAVVRLTRDPANRVLRVAIIAPHRVRIVHRPIVDASHGAGGVA
jgi:hypothetical protein